MADAILYHLNGSYKWNLQGRQEYTTELASGGVFWSPAPNLYDFILLSKRRSGTFTFARGREEEVLVKYACAYGASKRHKRVPMILAGPMMPPTARFQPLYHSIREIFAICNCANPLTKPNIASSPYIKAF